MCRRWPHPSRRVKRSGAQLPVAGQPAGPLSVLEPKWLRSTATSTCLRVSESTKASIERFWRDNVTVVPEGFDPPAQVPDVRKEERPTLVWCARLVPYKRPLDAIEAFEIARRQIPDLRCG